MTKIRIQCSPLTENIYAGRVNKAGTAWAGEKTDVTRDVLGAVIQKISAGNIITVNENGKPAYEIEVRAVAELEAQLAAAAPGADERKPVAWMTPNDWGDTPVTTAFPSVAEAWKREHRQVTPLYE